MSRALDVAAVTHKIFRGEIVMANAERDVFLFVACNPEAERQSLNSMAKSLQMGKLTVQKALALLQCNGFIETQHGRDHLNRKRLSYSIGNHPALDFIGSTENLSVLSKTDTEPSVLADTDGGRTETLPAAPPAANSSHSRAHIVEAAREIERAFAGHGKFVPFRELNNKVEEFIVERGTTEFRAFSAWVNARSRSWRRVTVSEFEWVCRNWDIEKKDRSGGFYYQAEAETVNG